MNLIGWIVLALLLLQVAVQWWLEVLNRGEVRRHAGSVPEAFRGFIDPAAYCKSVAYTLARSRFGKWEDTWQALILGIALFSGVLVVGYEAFSGAFGYSATAGAAFLIGVGVLLTLPGLPFSWYAQFHLEERFGFNTSTVRTWWLDRFKALGLSLLLGYPLLWLLLKLLEWGGSTWWIWGWAMLTGFQLLMLVLAPVLIMPLFNRFTPLPEGPLRQQLLALAQRTGFQARSIQVMDGSKRSKHSNAFFTGFGRFRKIVLFDTLIEQLNDTQMAAVLAHEIGHYKRGHIPKLLLVSAASSLLGFYVLAWLSGQPWFYRTFGFAPGQLVPALLLFALLSGLVTFWVSPLLHAWSRRFEYQADAFAAGVMGESQSLIEALRKLSEKNLSNLTPHRWYSRFYYSHPTLLERENALARHGGSADPFAGDTAAELAPEAACQKSTAP